MDPSFEHEYQYSALIEEPPRVIGLFIELNRIQAPELTSFFADLGASVLAWLGLPPKKLLISGGIVTQTHRPIRAKSQRSEIRGRRRSGDKAEAPGSPVAPAAGATGRAVTAAD